MIEFRLVNFLPPDASTSLQISTPSGVWTIDKEENYDNSQKAIANNQCAETYTLSSPVSMDDGAGACDAAFDEITPILLASSYALGLSVTIKRSTPASDIMIAQPSDHWPRERAMGTGIPAVATDQGLETFIGNFVSSWATLGQSEKALLLVHHWLDALACWSFEDMYLSATTIQQIIVATEENRMATNLTFLNGVTSASNAFGIAPLSDDFKNMRNDLIHDGQLSGSRFPNKTKNECAEVAADVFNWIDAYMHAALNLGTPAQNRFSKNDFMALNSYSL